MNPTYAQDFTVPTSAVGASATLRLSALLGMMQDAASHHAEALGVGYDVLIAHRQAFVLSRLQIAFDGPWPHWGDTLHLRTWPRGVDRVHALRDFIIKRADGSIFLRGASAWLLIDADKAQILRADEHLRHIQPHGEAALDATSPARLRWQADAERVDERVARASDLDPNRHVNNTRYGDWIADAFAARHGLDAHLAAVSINYVNQVQPGERVNIHAVEDPHGALVVQGAVESGEGGAPRKCFIARAAS